MAFHRITKLIVLTIVVLFSVVHPQASASPKDGGEYDAIVAGGGPIGTMSAIAMAQAAKQAAETGGRSPTKSFRILVVDKKPKERTRTQNIWIAPIGIANMRSFGFDIGGPYPIKKKASAKLPWSLGSKHIIISSISDIEKAGYDAIHKWNKANPMFSIELKFGSTITDLTPAKDKQRHRVTIDGQLTKARHLIVADGGRTVRSVLERKHYLKEIDRGVETSANPSAKTAHQIDENGANKDANTPIRLTYMNESFLDTNFGATITVVGDALSKGHYARAAGMMRGTTDAVAIRQLFTTLLSPIASGSKRYLAKRTFRKSRLASIRKQHQIDRPSFETKGKGMAHLEPRIKDTSIAAKEVTHRLRKRRGDQTGTKRLWSQLRSISPRRIKRMFPRTSKESPSKRSNALRSR